MRALRLVGTISAACATFGATLFACATSEDKVQPEQEGGSVTIPDDLSRAADADANVETDCADAADCAPAVDCSTVDFCAIPLPVSRLVALNAVWGSGPKDVWAVGTRGTILHGDGSTFSVVPSDTTATFVSVWGTGSNDVWILDNVAPLHADGPQDDGGVTFERRQGSKWSAANAATGRIWTGFSATPNDVWIGGETSRRFVTSSSFWVLADGGSAWNAVAACSTAVPCTPKVRSIWGTDATTLWAVGQDGQGFRADTLNGGAPHWSLQNTHTRNGLESVWGSGPNDVWAVGQLGTILHTSQATGIWDATSSPTKVDLHSVWGSGPTDVWAVGDDGTVLHFDGQSWMAAAIGWPSGQAPTHLFGVWGSGPDDVWIVGQGVILHRTAASRRHP